MTQSPIWAPHNRTLAFAIDTSDLPIHPAQALHCFLPCRGPGCPALSSKTTPYPGFPHHLPPDLATQQGQGQGQDL